MDGIPKRLQVWVTVSSHKAKHCSKCFKSEVFMCVNDDSKRVGVDRIIQRLELSSRAKACESLFGNA